MDVMAVGALSIAMHQTQLQQATDVLMMRKAMDLQETQATALIEDLQQAVPSPSGHQLDILV